MWKRTLFCRQHVPLKPWHPTTKLQDITTKKDYRVLTMMTIMAASTGSVPLDSLASARLHADQPPILMDNAGVPVRLWVRGRCPDNSKAIGIEHVQGLRDINDNSVLQNLL
jgi:hypothetical protein